MLVTRVTKVALHAERGLPFLALDVDGGIPPGSPDTIDICLYRSQGKDNPAVEFRVMQYIQRTVLMYR